MIHMVSRIKQIRKNLEEFISYQGEKLSHHINNAPPISFTQFQTDTKRFITAIERLNNQELLKLVTKLNLNIENNRDLYELESDLKCIFDVMDDILYEQNEQLVVTFNSKSRNKLIDLVCDCLSSESANHLHNICNGHGLPEGTREEAFSGKRSYVYSRISAYTEKQIWDLSKKLEGKNDELDNLILSIENGDHLKLEAKFENIQQRIIEEIDKAEFLIWIAVAWFTDVEIARVLYQKKKQGIDIKIIVIDDEINNIAKDKFYQHFEIYTLPPTEKYKNIMHHKFCVLDLKKVIHGSYNWSVKAQYNQETITIVENKAQAEKFAREFIKIKSNLG